MVCARSCSFRRTIKGRLRRSLWWWLPHHCSVPPLPPATLVRLILELCWNSSLLQYHQQIYILIIAITNQHHALLYHSTTRAPPRSTHIPCLRPIISCMHQFSRSWVSVATSVTTLFLLWLLLWTFELYLILSYRYKDLLISWSYLLILSRRSYLGDFISWSTILSWSLDLIIRWWSKTHFFIWTLHYYLHAFDMPLTYVFHWQSVKLGVRTETSGPKSCKVLASTCRLRCSLAGCLKFRSSGQSRRVRSQAEKKLKKTRAS